MAVPGKVGKAEIKGPSELPGYLGGDDDSKREQEIEDFMEEMEEVGRQNQKLFGVETTCLAPGAGSVSKHHGESGNAAPKSSKREKSKPKRNRQITKLRIAVHGPTKGCQACKDGTYDHAKECRDRFNVLLDEQEPIPRSEAKGKVAEEVDDARSLVYEPSIVGDDLGVDHAAVVEDDHEDSGDVVGLVNVSSGSRISKESSMLEKGQEVVAAILIDAVEDGEDETNLAHRYQQACSHPQTGKPKKTPSQKEWFVEFCCSPNSSCCKVAEQLGINYLGLSEDFGNLLDDQVFEQVEYWFHERAQHQERINLFGSIPCGPFSALQNLNLHIQGERFQGYLQDERGKSLELVRRFHHLSKLAVQSGGSTSFEWPKNCQGWREPTVLNYVMDFNLFASYPTGCGFDLTIKGKKPLKEWRVVTTSPRLAAELNRYKCHHSKDHKHDPTEGGGLAALSGFYNLKMASVIVSSLCPDTVMNGVPSLTTVGGVLAHEERGLWMAQLVLAMVHKPLTRDEINRSPEAKAKLQEEAAEFRRMGVWDESTLIEVDDLISSSQKSHQKIHIAEMMPVCHIKGFELPKEQHRMRARLVFRGDDCKDEFGDKAIYKEMKSLPATVHSINMVLYHGLRPNNKCEISDATKAYLQAPLNSEIPTYVIIPKLIWKPEWHKKYRRVAARLDRALYGHHISGDSWFEYFNIF